MGITIDLKITDGDAIRLALLMTHYRSPLELGALERDENGAVRSTAKVNEARKILRRWALACEPNLSGPPIELIETLANDLNTPGCIALMHRYRAERQGAKLFASLRFLGFFGSLCLPDEIKTLPPGHSWSIEVIGPDVHMDFPS